MLALSPAPPKLPRWKSDDNPAVILVDGDNISFTQSHYRNFFDLQRLYNWVASPDNLGITEVVAAHYFRTRNSRKRWTEEGYWQRQVPISQPGFWQIHLEVPPGPRKGYPDSVIADCAREIADSCATFVIVSSDGGAQDHDGGFPALAEELREDYNREVVLVGSRVHTGYRWTSEARNWKHLEDIILDLDIVTPTTS